MGDGAPRLVPLAPAQRYYLPPPDATTLEPQFNVSVVIRLTGPLDRAALGETLRILVTRHEALRTTFRRTAAGLAQVVRPPADPPLTEADVRGRPQEYTRLLAELTARLFPLTEVPLRLLLARTGTEEHRLVWVVHHALFDGWSMGVLLEEFLAHYRALTRGVPPSVEAAPSWSGFCARSADAARRAGGAGRERAVEFWRGRVSGLEDVRLGQDLPGHPPQRGAAVRDLLDTREAGALRELARARRTSLFPLFLAAFSAVAHAGTGQSRFLLAASVATRAERGTDRLIGCLVNRLPLPCDLSGDPSVRELIDRTSRMWWSCYGQGGVDPEVLARAVGADGAADWAALTKVTRVVVVQESFSVVPPGEGPLQAQVERTEPDIVEKDLVYHITPWPTGEIETALTYRTARYAPAAVAELADRLRWTLTAMAGDPDRPLSALTRFPEPGSRTGAPGTTAPSGSGTWGGAG
ncbi:condensation domain-containing protein [Streptomyces carpaticus]|uniref:condensation domain-containing protein n=1 Tax=Streptomyces TaxID=1883 RepID=UPI00220AF7DB|nr:condensation domain-containing protein [Streptomyces carpaticus]